MMMMTSSFVDLHNLSEVEEAVRLLEETVKREGVIEGELEVLMKGSVQLEEKIRDFNRHLPGKLDPVHTQARALAQTITDTCAIADNISRKVRDLDLTRARLKETTKKVDDIIDIKNCIDVVKKAMEGEDYETAASHIQRYLGLNIDESVLEGTSYELLKSAEQQLKAVVRDSLEVALTNDVPTEIIRFCKLYAPLGLKEEGLTRYCHYLRRQCSNEADLIYKDLLRSLGRNIGGPMPTEPLTCVTTITKVFECVAAIIEEQATIVESHFGQGSGITMIRNLIAQCDAHAYKIMDLFLDNHGIIRKVQDLTQPRGLSEKERDPRELAHLLDDIVGFCKAAEFYARFIKKKVLGLTAVNTPANPPPSAKANGGTSTNTASDPKTAPQSIIASTGLLNSDISRRMHELVNHYISLEQYFMVESVQKAIKMDEQSGDTIVDDVFFVLQKCTQRAVDSHNIHALCAIINHLTTCLNKEFKDVLQKMFKEQLSKNTGRGGELKVTLLVVLNNMEVSAEYMLRLKKEIELKCEKIFSQPEDREKLKMTIVDLQDTSKHFKALLEACMEQLCSTLQPKMRAMNDLFDGVDYEITEQDYASNEINDPFAQQFIAEAAAFLKPFEEHFTPTNYDMFVHVVVGVTLKKFEKLLLQKRVSQLGALQFDKDFRAVSTYFSSKTQRTVRDKFARLTQMTSLLNLEKVSEVAEIWGENSGSIFTCAHANIIQLARHLVVPS